MAYTNDYAQKAIDELKKDNVDVAGTSFKPTTVTLEPGGA
jgi:NitT/TauT family transport system substrate-binding protein